ncbi:MAG: hypothetical protein V4467_03075 [Patescibacteria group bacterium]
MTCACGATTRKLYLDNRLTGDTLKAVDISKIPLLHIATGGVGSISSATSVEGEKGIHSSKENQLQSTCNWSGRIGGYAVVNPVAVISGRKIYHPPPATQGFHWENVYSGSTLTEWILVADDVTRHSLPVISLQRTCPICRKKQEVAELPEDLTVTRDELTVAGLSEEQLEEALSSMVNMEGGGEVRTSPNLSARLLLAYTHSESCWCSEAIVAAIKAAKKRSVQSPAVV